MKLAIQIPQFGESIKEITLNQWLVPNNSWVDLDQSIAELESEKANQVIESPAAGLLTYTVKVGDTLKMGDTFAFIDSSVTKPPTSTKIDLFENVEKVSEENPISGKEKITSTTSSNPVNQEISATPLAKKMILDNSIDTSSIVPSGEGGKITKKDLLEQNKNTAVQSYNKKSENNSNHLANRIETPTKLTSIRKTISKRLVEVKNATAMLTTFNEVDMSVIMEIRQKYKDSFKDKHKISLGFMGFFLKASSIALQEFPIINAYLDSENILYHNYVDISIAVSTEKGLTVPVIRNIQNLSITDIEIQVAELAQKARENKLSFEDLKGGTFTVTNGGVFGSLLSTPILNPPQSAILGMHKIEERPIVINHKIEIRPMMYLALSYDHRLVDGKDSVGFLVKIKKLLENPRFMVFGRDPIEVLLDL